MNSGYKIALTVVGVVATAAVLGLNAVPGHSTQLYSADIDNQTELEFANFVGKYGRQYKTSEEYQMRRGLFITNLQKIRQINSEQNSFRAGVNKFTDMSDEEYSKLLGLSQRPISEDRSPHATQAYQDAPTEVDWRKQGAVTKVKDQGHCGSCYAFSAAAALEGALFMQYGKTVDLSPQQIVDCSKAYNNMGCGGGLPDWAFDYVWDEGIMKESDYPYIDNSGACADDYRKYVAQVTRYDDIAHLDPVKLKAGVAQHGPISIGVGAGNTAWRSYQGGILDSPDCKPNLDHAVLLVGYGVEEGREYWIVKNSWSEDWGEQGYVRILISEGYGVCGVNMTPIWATVKKLADY